MLKSSNLLRNNLKQILLKRHYHYQNEIYTKSAASSLPQAIVSERVNEKILAQPNLYRYINAYRQYGYKKCLLDPLNQNNPNYATTELDPVRYGLQLNSSSRYDIDELLHLKQNEGTTKWSLEQIQTYLENIYSKHCSIEYDYLRNEEEKVWLEKEFEHMQQQTLDNPTRVHLLKLMLKSEVFDQFLGIKFPSFKRYSLEGGESALAFYESLFSESAQSDIEQCVMGIAHRGRLNLMVLMLNLSPELLFTKIKGRSEFSSDIKGVNGDVAHHFPCSTDLKYGDKQVHVSLLPNPSHLEAVDPLVMGKARSKQMYLKDGYYSDTPSNESKKVLSFLIHGDAAFAGQGIVTETFQLSNIPNYAVGGTVHLIINNQLGFTTPSHLGRSGHFNSDLGRAVDCPIIHVNGEHPELVYKAAQMALKYRHTFNKDVIVDLLCYRRWGHNELDDPSFTQPAMYQIINNRKSIPSLFEAKLTEENLVSQESLSTELKEYRAALDRSLASVVDGTYKIEPCNTYLSKQWSEMKRASSTHRTYWNTGCSLDLLKFVGVKSVTVPNEVKVHPTIERSHIKRRIERVNEGKSIDWATAEALAFGSLLSDGNNIRISGQDVGRGTFSQRHCLLVDQETSKTFVPLNNLNENQKNFLEVCNSPLSEEAVMGYDFGFSLDNPKNLVIWEAQFGDFFNGAQIILDTFISSCETKWLHQSGMVLLLPHGYDGAGPEHSSCRIERFLQSCSSKEDAIDSDDINYYVANPTTPANYFHLLRRQMAQPYRKPLVVASPKLLLRLPECISSLQEMGPNTRFLPVLTDSTVTSPESVKRVVFVFGKHYYALATEKANRKLSNVAIVRIEELCPFPAHEIRTILGQFKNAKEFVWAQEEHRNMGGWFFTQPRFENILGVKLTYAGRDVNSAPAVGMPELNVQEVKHILTKPFEGL